MAPRKKLDDDFDASATPSPLKPKTEKAKVEKVKSEKAKVAKPKKEKTEGEKPKAVKKAEAKKEKEKGDAGKKDGGKEKVKPVTGEEAQELILKYLKEQNRPYGATDVSANLHGKVTKTVTDKLLKEMEQNGLIKGKATKKDGGGQWVFWPVQDPADTATPSELAAMDISITTLKDSLPTLKSTLKHLTIKLTTLRSAPTTSELATMVDKLREENKVKGEKLSGFRDGSVKMVTREEVERVDKEFRYWGGKRGARKNAFGNLEVVLLEGMSREEVWERAGVEGDVY